MSPKTDQSVWLEVKSRYQAGAFKSLSELAREFGINKYTLQTRVNREKWVEQRERLLNKVNEKIECKVLSEAESYLVKTKKRMERYEAIIDTSLENHGSKDANNVPILDCEAINDYTLAETRVNLISLSALRIAQPVSQVQVTGSISMVSVIQQLRESKDKPALTTEDVSKYIDVEILPKASNPS